VNDEADHADRSDRRPVISSRIGSAENAIDHKICGQVILKLSRR
jgi:hypothetical protein